jgi:CheY-like chemotaxis protein
MLKGKTVLLVDDDDRDIFALSSVLKVAGVVIYIAKNGIECLEKLRTLPHIDIVLLDIMMPDMDGYETLNEIRTDEKLKHLPVISLTAQAMKGDQEKCLKAGADDYYSKPIAINILLDKIKILLHL